MGNEGIVFNIRNNSEISLREASKAIGYKIALLEIIKAVCVFFLLISSLLAGSMLIFGVVNTLSGITLEISFLLTVGVFGSLISILFKLSNSLARHVKGLTEKGVELQRSWRLYVKEDVLSQLTSPDEALKFQCPRQAIQHIIESTMPNYWNYGIGVHPESSYGLKDGEFLRAKREYPFVLLGFFSLKELKELEAFCKVEMSLNKGGDSRFYNALYAKCIKKYPKIVAAEAAYLSWMQDAFPYQSNASYGIFLDAWRYRSALFARISSFIKYLPSGKNEKSLLFFESLSGLGAVCLSNFLLKPEDLESISSCKNDFLDDWSLFCRKTSEYCSKTIFYRHVYGDLKYFMEFLEKGGDSSFFKERADSFCYKKESKNFFKSPGSLWDMGSLCANDPELMTKIEEGLSYLDNCGYLGSQSTEEIKHFERVVLGTERSK
ncbi:hypothetical protein [Chlamydiifrater volucris]|uniref:hypothetical protein n=1 Tax=Chlamydiifrater volucris TaxID=2681470 RepID=UPI001BCBC652|nr:hypothetical protein [Chlamydiifrater volucris]